jgi:hypothetical protein
MQLIPKITQQTAKAMLENHFEIKYIKDDTIPADYLSQNVLDYINIINVDLFQLQKQDLFCATLKKFYRMLLCPLMETKPTVLSELEI